MAGATLNFDFAELDKFNKTLEKIGGEAPARVATKAAKIGGRMIRARAVATAPVGETGELKGGIVLHLEKSRTKGKRVYDVQFDPAKNDIFQKPIKNPGEYGGKNPKAYYPASMEYGFLTRSKGGGLSYVPGYHFMLHAAEDLSESAKKTMMIAATDALEKEWLKKYGK